MVDQLQGVFLPVSLPKLLLVEDHHDTGTVFKRLLSQSGYDVALATSVADAVALFDQNHFDAMVSDIGLPDGSGLDVMRYVREKRHIPAIALSALASEQDIERSLAAGFRAHLRKPIDIVAVRMLIANLIHETRG